MGVLLNRGGEPQANGGPQLFGQLFRGGGVGIEEVPKISENCSVGRGGGGAGGSGLWCSGLLDSCVLSGHHRAGSDQASCKPAHLLRHPWNDTRLLFKDIFIGNFRATDIEAFDL